jgi:hypothetical protein
MTSQPLSMPPELPHESGDGGGASERRIDAPHATPSPANESLSQREHLAAEPSLASAVSEAAEGATALQQLRTQAVQLTDHLTSRQDDLDGREATLLAREAELESGLQNARLWFAEREAELDERRERWLKERRDSQRQLETARQDLDQQRRREWADLNKKRLAVSRRAEEVDRAWVALQQLHDEVGRIHRETLQLRLANEELRAELRPCLPAETQERMLNNLRARLSDEYRRAGEALARQKHELLELRRELAEQHRKLSGQRDKAERSLGSARP